MCYDFKSQIITQLKRARENRDSEAVRILEERLRKLGAKDYYRADAFRRPAILIYTKEKPHEPILARWGYIPADVMADPVGRLPYKPQPNSRGEEMFRKWSFKRSANSQRCLICIDGFFEHYHYKGKAYPYYIHNADDSPMTLAGLWSEWTDKESGSTLRTFSIVTSAANELMAKIHNNPKIPEPRMPLILPESIVDEWLTKDITNETDRQKILDMVRPYEEKEIKAYTVSRMRGKNITENHTYSTAPAHYPELDENSEPTLF